MASRAKKIVSSCAHCGEMKMLLPCNVRKNNFCDKKCFHLFLKGKSFSPETRFKKGHPSWNKGKKTGIAPWRGKKRTDVSGENHFLNRNPEKRIRGENHYRYIHDRTQLAESRSHAYGSQYKEWMRQVKNRDYWKCQIANDDCSGRVEAHHILSWRDFPELRFDVKNGITLCHFHHPKSRDDENKYVEFFQGIIENK